MLLKTNMESITRYLKYKVVDSRVASCLGLNKYQNMLKNKVRNLQVVKESYLNRGYRGYKCNRVEKIILDKDYIEMGIGDIYVMKHHAHEDESCKWISTDKNIVSIDMHGNILAKKSGQCEVICIIGNVSSKCRCIIKPYLDKILVNNSEHDSNTIFSASKLFTRILSK